MKMSKKLKNKASGHDEITKNMIMKMRAKSKEKCWERYITNWNPINERILTTDLKIKKIRIFGIYASIDDSDFGTKKDFFENPSKELNKTKLSI